MCLTLLAERLKHTHTQLIDREYGRNYFASLGHFCTKLLILNLLSCGRQVEIIK